MKRLLIILLVLIASVSWAADVKISNLPATTTLEDTDVMPAVAGTTTSKITVTNLKTLFGYHAGVTLSTTLGANLLGLSTQQLTLDDQTANYVFAGPTTGEAAAPSFRALVAADIPSLVSTYQPLNGELTALAGLTSAANAIPYFTGSGTAGVISSSADMVALLGAETYAAALGLLSAQASDSALTTLSSKTFSKTALTGTGGLDTVAYADLADGDIGMVGTTAGIIYWYVFESSSSTAESSPNTITPDDAGANNGRWLLKLYCDGSSCSTPRITTGAASTLLEGSGNGDNFRKWSVPDALTADLNLQHPNALPAANQFQLFPAPTDGVSAYTWTTYGQFGVDLTATSTVNLGDGGDDVIIKNYKNATNEKYSGIVQSFTCHETIAFGQPVVINGDGEVALANADTPASLLPAIGLAVVGGNAAATCTVLTHGSATDTDWNWTPGATIYVDDSAAGVLTATVGDITTGNGVQVIGIATHADSILVMPSLSIVVLE